MTFSLNAADPDVWRTELKQFWQQWVAQLNGAMPDMMLNSVDAGQRSQLFSFTRQMQGLHDYVVQLLEGILYRGEHAQPLLRGLSHVCPATRANGRYLYPICRGAISPCATGLPDLAGLGYDAVFYQSAV